MERTGMLVFLFLTLPLAAQDALRNASRECAICHIRWVDALAAPSASNTGMNAILERQAGSGDMCLSCHDGSVADSRFQVWSTRHHTTQEIPSSAVRIPTDIFPLDAQGRMNCATCHTAHAVPDSSDLKTVIFLRQPNIDSSICLACHGQYERHSDFQHPLGTLASAIPPAILRAGGKTAADGRTMICQTCHEPHGAQNDWMLVLPPSELCIACHTDKNAEVAAPAGAPVHHIGQTYPGFDPPSSLLAQGAAFGPLHELSCLSCHRLHDASGARPLLIRPNEGSSLCLDCHPAEKTVLRSPHDLHVSAPEAVNASGANAETSGPCGACHQVHGWARDVAETLFPHSAGCLDCHQSSGPGAPRRPYRAAHPIGVTVPEGRAAGLPLTEGSRVIGCLTCHDPHTPRIDQNLDDETAPRSFLRRPAARLCVSCHDDQAPTVRGPHNPENWPPALRQKLALGTEAGVCQVCHQTHGLTPTRSCTDCHEGSIVPVPAVTRHGPGDSAADCRLCHDPHGGDVNGVALRHAGEALCLSCHEAQAGIRGSLHDPRSGPWAQNLDFASQGLCLDCHPIHREQNTGALFQALGISPRQASGCRACHQEQGPGAAVVTPHLGAPIPGAAHRAITCETCHNIHQQDSHTPLLREPRESGRLCLHCHTQMEGLLSNAHDLRRSAPEAQNRRGETPDRSGPCGTCHQVHTETAPRPCTDCHGPNSSVTRRMPDRVDHPEVVLFNRHDPNRPGTMPTYTDTGVLSATGQIACQTCHEPHGGPPPHQPSAFLRSGTGQQLCVDCHGPEATWRYLYFHHSRRDPGHPQ
jgi:predicted CXXCH cytochrome family protein